MTLKISRSQVSTQPNPTQPNPTQPNPTHGWTQPMTNSAPPTLIRSMTILYFSFTFYLPNTLETLSSSTLSAKESITKFEVDTNHPPITN